MAIYQQVMCATDYLRIKVHYRPMVGIICGTGLDSLADLIANPRIVRYDDIPGFPNCEVIGDEGKFIFGEIGGKHVVLLQRRLRTYESNDYSAITIPIRIIRLLGAKYLFVTTTAGGINPLFKVGDLVLVKDHVDFSSLVGNNPLIGSHNPRFGDHFPTLLGTYDKFLRDLAVKSMSELKMECEMLEGVYFHIAGPAYETPATSRMLQLLGCDVIGMSLTQEVLIAKHQRMKILAICLITNRVTTDSNATDDHNFEAEMRIARMKGAAVGRLIERIISNTPSA